MIFYLVCAQICIQKDNVMDAIRIADGAKVVLKRVSSRSYELLIHSKLSSQEMRTDPRNRTVPLISVIPLPDHEIVLLVVPYLRIFASPPFHCRAEFVEALRQLIKVRGWNPPVKLSV